MTTELSRPPAALAAPEATDASRPGAAARLLAAISRLHIVAIAVMGTLTFGWLFTGRWLALAAAVTGLDWFIVNLMNRAADVEEDRANRIAGAGFAGRHRRAILATGAGALLASLAAVHAVAPVLLPWRIAYHALGLLYNFRLLPGRRRIKELYFFKNAASASGFLITCFAYPLALASAAGTAFPAGIDPLAIALTGAFFFLFELSYEVIYDLRDAPGDARAGVRTYPVVHGERGAVRIVDALIAAAALVLIASFAAGAIPWRIFVMALAPALQVAYSKRALRRGITSADCIRLTWIGALLLLAYHLWILAGLPGVAA